MAKEKKRGCGFRKVNCLYLVGKGIAVPCDGLPLVLDACPTCGFEIPFFRGFKWISKKLIGLLSEEKHAAKATNLVDLAVAKEFPCLCEEIHPTCPICFPDNNDLEKYSVMWVGERFYTPDSFMKEAREMGVCKKLNKIPKDLVLGKTWIMLAHPAVPIYDDPEFVEARKKWRENLLPALIAEDLLIEPKPPTKPAIFYAFIPSWIEKLLFKGKVTEQELEELKKQGITPVLVDEDEDHIGREKPEPKNRGRPRKNLLPQQTTL